MAKTLFRRLGIEIRSMPEKRCREVDAHAAQSWLLRGQEVKVVFDVGANVGQTAHNYRKLHPRATIYSFEPFEDSFAELTRAFAGDEHVRPHKLAVSNVSESRRLFVNAENMTNSLLPSAPGAAELVGDGLMSAIGSVDVPTTTIDEFCRSNGIVKIDILKMDIQGGELMALRGARRMLSEQAIPVIYSEVLFAPLYENQAFFGDVAAFLRSFGYVLYGLYDLIHPGGKCLAWADAVFISPTLARDKGVAGQSSGD